MLFDMTIITQVDPTKQDLPGTISVRFSADTEYKPNTNERTIPLTVQVAGFKRSLQYTTSNYSIYSHPQAPEAIKDLINPYQTPFCFLDYIGVKKWMWLPYNQIPKKPKGKGVYKFHFDICYFFAAKDLEYLFSDQDVYLETILPHAEEFNRTTVNEERQNEKGDIYMISRFPIIKVIDRQKHYLCIECPFTGVIRKIEISTKDYSALAGKTSLKNLSDLLGIKMDAKEVLTLQDKQNMDKTIINKLEDFLSYAKSDVIIETEEGSFCLFEKLWDNALQQCIDMWASMGLSYERGDTSSTFNNIRTSDGVYLELMPIFSMGKKVAALLSDWLTQSCEDKFFTKGVIEYGQDEKLDLSKFKDRRKYLHLISQASSADSFEATVLAATKSKQNKDFFEFMYFTQIDGGRATSEFVDMGIPDTSSFNNMMTVLEMFCLFYDLDFSGMYAAIMASMKFPIGTPCYKIKNKYTLKQMLEECESELVDGLWYARISTTEPLSFYQDVILSKAKKSRKSFDLAVYGDDDEDSVEYEGCNDKETLLLLNEIHQGVITSDVLDFIKTYASKAEYKELLEKCVVHVLMYYPKSSERKRITEDTERNLTPEIEMTPNGLQSKDCTDWISVYLEPFISKISFERSKHPKKTPENEMWKLVANTVFGASSSRFFSNPKEFISNLVIGNNITARGRMMIYTASKSLMLYQNITDGGVFNLGTKVIWKKTSLNNFAHLKNNINRYQDMFGVDGSNRHTTYSITQLIDMKNPSDEIELCQIASGLSADEIKEKITTKEGNAELFKVVDELISNKAMDAIKENFPKLKLWKLLDGKAKIEGKAIFRKFTPQGKVSYLLEDVVLQAKGETEDIFSFRGMSKKADKDNSMKLELFKAIQAKEFKTISFTTTRLRSFSEFHNLKGNRTNILKWLEEGITPGDEVSVTTSFSSHTPRGGCFSNLKHEKQCHTIFEHLKGFPPEATDVLKDKKDEILFPGLTIGQIIVNFCEDLCKLPYRQNPEFLKIKAPPTSWD
jgi:hypothetical protein